MFSITAAKKPRWNDLRWKLSNALVKLARLIYPKNPEVDAFLAQQVVEQMIYGKAVTRVSPEKFYNTPES